MILFTVIFRRSYVRYFIDFGCSVLTCLLFDLTSFICYPFSSFRFGKNIFLFCHYINNILNCKCCSWWIWLSNTRQNRNVDRIFFRFNLRYCVIGIPLGMLIKDEKPDATKIPSKWKLHFFQIFFRKSFLNQQKKLTHREWPF